MKSQAFEKEFVFPVLETERLLLRMFDENDFEAAFKLFNDSDVQKYLSPKNRRTYRQMKSSLKNFIKRWQERGFGLWCITAKDGGEMIGYSGFQYLEQTKNIEIVFAFFKEYWGKGIATEAANACLEYGFKKLDFDKIYAATAPQNVASRLVLEKLRMRFEQTTFMYDMEVAVFSIAREKYNAK